MTDTGAEVAVGISPEVGSQVPAGIVELKGILKEKADQLFPETKPVSTVQREDYNSRVYQFEEGATHSIVDGQIYDVGFGDGSKTYVVRYKTSGGNPFASPFIFGEALPGGGLDGRAWETFIYEWDGQETIKATPPDGKVVEVKGDFGKPEALLPTLHFALGHFKETVDLSKPRPAGLPSFSHLAGRIG